MGAKNHAVVMPDADVDATVKAIAGAAFGAAGQRCMAISAAVFVGGFERWRGPLLEAARSLKVDGGFEEGADVGPMISKEALARAEAIIQKSVDQGAKLLLDGRGVKVPKYPRGNFLGPTLLGGVAPGMECYDQEVFGPVLVCLDAPDLDAAIALVNSNEHGNGTAIFTHSGAAARKFQHEIGAGMVGINVPIPVPLPFFSFTGWRGSFAGALGGAGLGGELGAVNCIFSCWSPVHACHPRFLAPYTISPTPPPSNQATCTCTAAPASSSTRSPRR
jgi:malonate-semialdehyde dehydrogenase (acetylating)/methylmalonate-semialdehyde dehydrogenase